MPKHQKNKKTISGAGLKMSKMYLDSWILPVRVQVCEISKVNEGEYSKIVRENEIIFHYVHLPKQKYFYNFGTLVSPKLLQLPYRIYIQTQDHPVRGGIWYIENEADFQRYCRLFAHSIEGEDMQSNIKIFDIEQQPSGETAATPLPSLHPPRPEPRFPAIGYENPPPPARIGQVHPYYDDGIPNVDTFAIVSAPKRARRS